MIDMKDLSAYNEWRQAVFLRFKVLRHGAQMDAAHDLRISPSMVSGILRGRYIDAEKLKHLEVWLDKNEYTHLDPNQKAFMELANGN